MSAYRSDPGAAPARIQSLRARTARHWALQRQSSEPVLYSDFFRDEAGDASLG